MCPTGCTCRQSDKGRRRVSCPKGGMLDPIPIQDMSPDMEVLDISAPADNWNKLTLGPLFQNFKSLQELHITRSNILQIGMHAFWGVPSLQVLNLSFNNITAVFDHNFRGLVNLIELYLNDNRIHKLPMGSFKHLSELRVLNLERNQIADLVPRLFVKLSKLEVLKLSFNPVLELNPEVFKDIPELRVLQCRGCGLRRINTQIYHLLPYLSHLDLGNNRMQFVEADEFVDLHRLRVLRMDGNQLPVVLEKTFVNNVHLRSLCLARNRLAKVTNEAFLNLTNLVELDISYNKLDKLEGESLQPVADKLQKLLISGNLFGLPVIRTALQIASKVNDLGLADMKIAEIPAGLLPDHIQRLNLSGNYLSNVSLQMLPLQLVALDISRNKLRGLKEHVIMRLEELEEVRLENNSWSCDLCHISPMLFRANQSRVLKGVKCATPASLKGRLLSSLSYEEVKVCDEGRSSQSEFATFVKNKLALIIGGSGLLLFLIFCILFVVISCIRRHSMHNRNQVIKDKEDIRLDTAAAIFVGSKNEITFKFPLDLTERKVSVSTIDEMKKDTLRTLPNGTGI
ncbi:PREDICTED: leucine-rich repeat-containing protein 15-like [Nicrophorus vespilloides]|uniref:Leucine-rich repeat-containing protein 15-like n=1 Tax=Nicrophorus vespilloides TaxID=110193 RepID=A0ABM1MYC3_NICVS|nr:PREDICTED: leucine-rich repeat-containing protein 15-like [Nicrophorus vespilloides]